jgi:hypothetical protein
LETFYGPPNYGENPKTDSRETQAILVLAKPICVDASPSTYEERESKQRKITLVPPLGVNLGSYGGRFVTVTGTLFHAHTGHHHTQVLMQVAGSEEACSSLASRAEAAQGGFHPPAEAKVVGNDKLFFYEAPSIQCRIPKLYTVPDSYLTVYRIHNGWAQVMFVPKDGNDVIAWVPSNRIKLVGQYGRTP